jgi:hypothetical protein
VDVAAGVEVVEVVEVVLDAVDVVVAAAAVTEAAAHRGAAAVIVESMQFLAHWRVRISLTDDPRTEVLMNCTGWARSRKGGGPPRYCDFSSSSDK